MIVLPPQNPVLPDTPLANSSETETPPANLLMTATPGNSLTSHALHIEIVKHLPLRDLFQLAQVNSGFHRFICSNLYRQILGVRLSEINALACRFLGVKVYNNLATQINNRGLYFLKRIKSAYYEKVKVSLKKTLTPKLKNWVFQQVECLPASLQLQKIEYWTNFLKIYGELVKTSCKGIIHKEVMDYITREDGTLEGLKRVISDINPDKVESITINNYYFFERNRNNNMISFVPKMFGNPIKARSIYFTFHSLRKIPIECILISYIRVMILDCNQITEIPESLRNARNLEVLNINNNKLTEIPPFVFRLPRFISLNANSNQIYAIPTTIPPNSAIKSMCLRGNRIKSIPLGLTRLLAYLDISYNPIENIPGGPGWDSNSRGEIRYRNYDAFGR